MITTRNCSKILFGSATAMALAIGGLSAAPASAGTYPGDNGLVAFIGKTQQINDGFNLYTYDPKTDSTEQLTFGSDSHLYPQWSADGRKISYTHIDNVTGELNATIINYDGTGDYKIDKLTSTIHLLIDLVVAQAIRIHFTYFLMYQATASATTRSTRRCAEG